MLISYFKFTSTMGKYLSQVQVQVQVPGVQVQVQVQVLRSLYQVPVKYHRETVITCVVPLL